MKEILRLLLVFAALLVLVSVLFAALGLLGFLGRLYAAKSVPQLSMVLARLPALLLERLPLVIPAALLLLLARPGLHPGRSPVAFVLVAGAAFALLVLCFPLLEKTAVPGPAAGVRAAPPLLAPGYWHGGDGRAYYLEADGEGRLRSLLVVDPAQPRARFRYLPAGEAAEGVLAGLGAGAADHPPPDGSAELSVFTPERFTGQLDHDLELLIRELARSRRVSPSRYLLASFALILAFMSAVFLLRLSRWPLLNFFLSLATLRFVFYLFRLIREQIAEELETLIASEALLDSLPTLMLLVFSGLLLLLHLLFLPARRAVKAGAR